jgi:hypothetical protein
MFMGRRNTSVDTVTRLRAGRPGVEIPAGEKLFIFSKAARSVLGSTQSPIQWAPRLFR